MKKMLLLKNLLVTCLFMVTFFSIKENVYSASFEYKNFDWDSFLEQNVDHWSTVCDESVDDKCLDKVLMTKKRFYTRLYEILTEVTDEYGFIDDNIIIATSFYGMDGDSFDDPISQDEYNPYNLDDSDDSESKNKYIGDIGNKPTDEDIEYFRDEKDSLKTLINNFIGYKSTCYAYTNETPTASTVNGQTVYSCSSSTMFIKDGKCIDTVDSYKGTFFDSLGLSFLGSDNKKKCEEDSSKKGYYSPYLETSNEKVVDEEFYWSFLEESAYLDNKDQLQSYYISILGKVKKNHMNELTTDEMEEYRDEIIKVRKRIIKGIKEVLKYYEGISEEHNKKVSRSDAYWWPIGSIDTTESNGKLFASNEPEFTQINSNYGNRILEGVSQFHTGIDLHGIEDKTYVIASKSGTIIYAPEDGGKCPVGDDNCGSGYGNYVIIQHLDGNYTLYAHMAANSVVVKNGEHVEQGQVLGKIGNTGWSRGAHLHFEVRVGGYDINSTQDPINYIDSNNPRPSGSSSNSEFHQFLINMEGGNSTIEGDSYRVIDVEGNGTLRTFGHGITVENNPNEIRANGLEPNSIKYGDLIPIDVADKIYDSVIEKHFNSVKTQLSSRGINLNEHQIDALTSLNYNAGNILDFFPAYETYGITQSLCTNWWYNHKIFYPGHIKRRRAECDLFITGVYDMNIHD